MQPTINAAWNERVAANPERVALRYFDGALTAAELDAHSDALAVELQSRGVARGDRIGIYLQNVPHYPISLLAIWKAGAIAVPLNPMYLGGELDARRKRQDHPHQGGLRRPGHRGRLVTGAVTTDRSG